MREADTNQHTVCTVFLKWHSEVTSIASFEVGKGHAALILNVDEMRLAQIPLHSFIHSVPPKTDPPLDAQVPWCVLGLHRQEVLYVSSGSQITVETATGTNSCHIV